MRTALLLILISVNSVYAQETAHYVEATASGGLVNWTTAKIQAEGFGLAPEAARPQVAGLLACRAAVADGQRNLLETIQGVRVSAETSVSNYVATNDVVKTAVEGTVKGARILTRDILPDGKCKVMLEVSVQGDVTASVYETQFTVAHGSLMPRLDKLYSWLDMPFFANVMAAPVEQADGLEAPWEISIKQLLQRVEDIEKYMSVGGPNASALDKSNHSGIVIDARGSNFIPSMSPKLRKLRGEVLYPTRASGQESRKSGQLVSLFTRSVELALSHPKVGNRPLLLKALRTYGDTRTEIVIGSESAKQVKQLVEQTFFNEGGVIIVLD
jgi:hypothetical protein